MPRNPQNPTTSDQQNPANVYAQVNNAVQNLRTSVEQLNNSNSQLNSGNTHSSAKVKGAANEGLPNVQPIFGSIEMPLSPQGDVAIDIDENEYSAAAALKAARRKKQQEEDEYFEQEEAQANARATKKGDVQDIAFSPKSPNAAENQSFRASERSRGRQMAQDSKKQASSNSLPSHDSSSKFSNNREISETFSTKFVGMFWSFLSLSINIFLFVYFMKMKDGLVLPIPKDSVTTVGTVVIEIILILTNLLTLKALNDAASVYFGQKLSEKNGYSLAVAGFVQAFGIKKYFYCSELSLNSTCRRFLTRLSWIWVVLEIINILSPFAATSVSGQSFRIDDGTVNCIIFDEKTAPVDRSWPTAEAEQGYAELVFGTSLGNVRSQFPADFNVTVGVMAPQIVGAVEHGDTITGPGFVTDIFTECQCTKGDTAEDIYEISDHVQSLDVAGIMLQSHKSMVDPGMINHLRTYEDKAVVTSILSNFGLCGGANETMFQVCKTTFDNHKRADILIEYMTDGTPASIAAKAVTIRSIGEPGDITWVHAALTNILEVQDTGATFGISRLPLLQTVPGITNPLLWWTTPNLIMIDLSLLDAGLETTFAMLLRAGMQRSFSLSGETCVMNVAVAGESVVTMSETGINILICILSFQLLVVAISLAAFIPWLLNPDPISPCIRLLRDNIYFATLLNSSAINTGFYELCNAPSHSMWQAVDVIIRVGESIQTVSEDVGHIAMDKAKLIRKLVNGKKYR